jgi:FAD/FMN-containing dehydrogenase
MAKTDTAIETAASELEARLRGRLVRAGDADYDEVRAVHNGMIDKKPALIAQCVDVADVVAAVEVARDNGVLLAVRSGGHNAGGLGSCDGGLVIDLSPMNGVHVDPEAKTVRAQGGCTWGDIDHATHPFGLAVPAGIISTTGVGGLTLGGGMGHLSRKYGLTIDNLLGVEMVLADGSIVTADADTNADLFWAIRGGGGNFGVVTSFLFRGNPVRNVIAGPTFWNIEQTEEVLRWYREFLPNAPEDLNGWFAFLTVPPVDEMFPKELHLQKVCGVVWTYTGDPAKADEVLAPIRAFGPPILDGIGEVPYPALQSIFDALYPPGLQWYWRADFFKEITDEAILVHRKFAEVPTMHSTMHLYPIDGAAHRPGSGDTAFSYRDATWSGVIVGVDPDPANADLIKQWAIEYWEALHPQSSGGAYVNFMMDEGTERVQATYRDNFDRLARVKAKYDPTNLFRVNQNIPPAS